MSSERDGIRRFTTDDVGTWHKSERGGVFLSDVVDATNGDSMSVGFARYEPRASNEWVVTYDEALITTRGVFTVTSEDGVTTAAEAGEVIFLTRGTPVVYAAGDAGADIVYVTYPHWMDAQQASEQAALLGTFTPIEGAPPPTHRELLRRAWGPLERGESDDMGPVFDLLAEDVVFKTPVGELRGKEQVMGYFAHGPAVIEFDPFVRPPEYFGDGERVVQIGDETFKVKATGATHRAEWAWVFDMADGLVTRITAIQDLSGIAEAEGEVVRRARAA
jgi:ethanolamine utilization protein EutQ